MFPFLSLAGKPKKPNALKTICMMLGPDFITDIIEVRICDCRILFVPWCYCACNDPATSGRTMVVSTAVRKKQKKHIWRRFSNAEFDGISPPRSWRSNNKANLQFIVLLSQGHKTTTSLHDILFANRVEDLSPRPPACSTCGQYAYYTYDVWICTTAAIWFVWEQNVPPYTSYLLCAVELSVSIIQLFISLTFSQHIPTGIVLKPT